jgi:hypothetical protein
MKLSYGINIFIPIHKQYVSTPKLSLTGTKHIFEVRAVMYGILKLYRKPYEIVTNVKLKNYAGLYLIFT